MNWDKVEAKWQQIRGKIKTQWGKLTDDDLKQIEGRREELVGRIHERYGIARDEAERQADDFVGRL